MKTPHLSEQEAAQRYRVLDEAVLRFRGTADELEAAIGMYVLGRHVGWKVLHVIHSKRTIAKYESILGIKVREAFPEFGPDAERANAYKLIKSVSSFWKLVSGDEKPPIQVDKRTIES